MKEMKLAIRDDGGTRFVPLIVDDDWVKQHGSTDEAESVALAMRDAQWGMRLVTMLTGTREPLARVRLSTSLPEGAVSVINPNLGTGLTCFICLCDAQGNCVCTPCESAFR